ncbi:MAG: hypothetical protein FWF72_02915 [Paludibacter sp.]|nr:hypothetical protein [Paludibacter sp.]
MNKQTLILIVFCFAICLYANAKQNLRAYYKYVAAMSDLNKLTDLNTSKNTTIPPYLRFGYLIAETKSGKFLDKIPIPLLLPVAETAAVLFDMDNLKPDEIPALFQQFALRYP